LLGNASLTHDLVIEAGQFGLHLLVDTGGPAPVDMFDIFECGTAGLPEPDVHSIHWGTASFEISPTSGFDGLLGVQLSIENYAYATIPAGIWLFGSGLLGLIGVSRRRKAA
jgi:hypothetical protein